MNYTSVDSYIPPCTIFHMMTSLNGTFSALPAFCAGNSPVTGKVPSQRPMTRSIDVFFDMRLNKRLSKQSWGWWFETPSGWLWLWRNSDIRIPLSWVCFGLLRIHYVVTSVDVCHHNEWLMANPSRGVVNLRNGFNSNPACLYPGTLRHRDVWMYDINDTDLTDTVKPLR